MLGADDYERMPFALLAMASSEDLCSQRATVSPITQRVEVPVHVTGTDTGHEQFLRLVAEDGTIGNLEELEAETADAHDQ